MDHYETLKAEYDDLVIVGVALKDYQEKLRNLRDANPYLARQQQAERKIGRLGQLRKDNLDHRFELAEKIRKIEQDRNT